MPSASSSIPLGKSVLINACLNLLSYQSRAMPAAGHASLSVCTFLRLSLQQPLMQGHNCRHSWAALRIYSRWQWAAALAPKRPVRYVKSRCPSPSLGQRRLGESRLRIACRLGIRRASCSAADVDGQTEGRRREEPSFRAYIDFQALKPTCPGTYRM